MIYAVVKEDLVENVIVIEPEQVEEMAEALGAELVDAKPYGLMIGDLRTERGWTRNAGGEQEVLPELPEEDYSSYALAREEAAAANARAERAGETAAARAAAIVSGEVEDEAQPALMAARRSLDALVMKIADTPKEINDNLAAIRSWTPGKYEIGDVRQCEGTPYRCAQAHDSTSNPDWTPEQTPALWAAYHGTSRETARPFVQPLGAHDQYLVGEWCTWQGGVYECVQDTVYDPGAYAQAWRKEEA